MDLSASDMFERLKRQYAGMDLEMVQFFAGAMLVFHEVPIMMESYFQRLGLSKARFMVMIQLQSLDPGDGMGIGEIIDGYEVSTATMTGVVDTLEREGWIERYPCENDRRRVNVRITEAGRDFMNSFLPIHHENMLRFTEALSMDERRQLLTLISKLQKGIAEVLANDSNLVAG